MRPRNQPEILLRRADRSDLGALLSLIHRFATESGESGGGWSNTAGPWAA